MHLGCGFGAMKSSAPLNDPRHFFSVVTLLIDIFLDNPLLDLLEFKL
jgi:hypothetical protein